ncbi:uncharacterized protein LOC6033318 isoform X3 [Culex quinquefasciatus]|uniref:uncharacterized protein LOC6033318 isoform X3 n=1 Tax=Culex quinquefasciatus TaxID=7176 RepID=UPI0018E37B63|nr:uncharacterized protein LOC6033318 isoform X3 [Culex quinquefasciatus]
MDSGQFTVQAQYSFKGSNNDELCFKKGDIITLTQREDGGWWEGTLGEMTGWFPSNYVKEYVGPLPLSETIRPPEDIQAFRSVVFRDLLESERAHVAELRGMMENFLEPLEGSQILSQDEYTQLMCNFVEVVEMHEEFLQNLEESNDRVGKVFLTKAPTMKKVHQCYCAAHPRAVVIVDKYRDDLNAFMEKQGAAKPGLLVLTTGLSKPFRRLDKYSAILQELERHMESCHADRGDTQRSIAVYKDIASSCSATRRQKELELQILTGPIRGWQGQELTTLGEIIHMGSVAVGPEHKDRYFVLFPQTLLILSVSQRMSAFKYEGKLPLTGISVNRLEDTDQIKNAFEVTGTLIDRIVAVCQGPSEANKWVDLLSAKLIADGQQQQQPGKDMKRIVSSSAVNIPLPPPHQCKETLDPRGYCTRVSVCAYSQSPGRTTFPPSSYPPTAPYAALTSFFRRLLRSGGMSRYIVQALLYPQITARIDTGAVVLRRKHRTTVRMYRRGEEQQQQRNQQQLDGDSDEYEEEEAGSCTSSCSAGSNGNNLERQNAVDYGDDEDPYETITFFTEGRKQESDEVAAAARESTIYESYGGHPDEADEAFFYVPGKPASGNVGSEERKSVESHGSHIIGSRAIPCLKLNDCESFGSNGGVRGDGDAVGSIHTTTARLHLGEIRQQCSEQSQVSSFEHRVGHGRMACEDLVNLDDSMKIKHSLQQKPIIEERHSMPTLFVGNRFASSSVTEIFIPSWKDRQDPPPPPPPSKPTEDRSSFTTHHSSTLDIPAPEAPLLSVPDHVTAELLYNFHNSHHSPSPSVVRSPVTSWCKILTPPQEFGTLSREMSPFRKHSLNSDKKLVLNQTHLRKGKDDEEARSATTTTSATSPRRCVSYQYVNMGGSNAANTSASNASGRQNKNNSPEQTHAKCRFCDSSCSAGGSRCHSPRSSDSEHGTDAAGGGQRSQLRHSRSSHNIGRFAPLLRDDSEFNFTDSGQYDHHQHHGALAQATTTGSGDPNQTRNNTLRSEDSELGGGMMKFARSRSEERVSDDDEVVEEKKQYSGRSRIVVNLTGSGLENGANEHKSQTTIYRTGLYAHWWKKEKLPIFVVGATTRQGAAEERRNELPGGSCGGSGDHFVDGGGGGDGRDAVVDVARGSDVPAHVRRQQHRQQPPVTGQRLHHTAHVATQTQPVVQPPPELQPSPAATAAAAPVPKTPTVQFRCEPDQHRVGKPATKPKRNQGKS